MAEDAPKDFWDKLRSVSTSISLIAVPILVAYIGSIVTRGSTEADTRQRTVQLAVSILQERPKEGAASSLRLWAIDVINTYSGIPLPASAKEELEKRALPGALPIPQGEPLLSKYVNTYLDQDTPPVSWQYGTLSFVAIQDNAATIKFGKKTVLLTQGTVYEDPDNHCALSFIGFNKHAHVPGILVYGACP